jgi:PAS domain S-box-containing protein
LRHIATLIALAIAVMTLAAYWFIGHTTEKRELTYLEEYVTDRVEYERHIFRLTEQNQAVIKTDMIDQLKALGQSDPVDEFNRLFKRYPDGVLRMHTPAKKGDKVTTAYIDDSLEITADIRRRMIVFEKLAGRYGPVWNHVFPNLYIFSEADNMEAQYWPENADWDYIIGPDYDMSGEEWAYASNVEHNPERTAAWTGLYWDDVAQIWMVSCSTPVDIDERHIASIGQDIYLDQLIARSIHNCLEGAENIIFRADGRLVAQRDQMQQSQQEHKLFNIMESGNQRLKRIYEAVSADPEVRLLELPEDDLYLAVGKIDEPEWFFVVAYPTQIISAVAFRSSMIVLLVGVGLLAIELVIVYLVLRYQVGSPLSELTGATLRVANNESNVRLPADRKDEFGYLARSFNKMVARTEDLIQRLHTRIQQKELAEKALQRSQDELQSLMDKSPAAISWADLQGNVRYSNQRFIDLFGYTLEDMPTIEQWYTAAYPDPDYRRMVVSGWENAVNEAIENNSDIAPHEASIVCKNGSVRYVEVVGTISQDRILVTFNDLTERKKQEIERERLLKMLKNKNDELQSIVHVTSHDLRSPLVNIQGFSGELSKDCQKLIELLESDPANEETKKQVKMLLERDIPESLRFILAGSTKMDELLGGLLQISRIGSTEIQIKPLDMNALLDSVVNSIQFQINEFNIHVTVDRLPSCCGDANQVNQIFSNLVENAIKYRDPKRQTEVHIHGKIEHGMSVYRVTDNGIGIDPSYHEKIFEVFHRLDPQNIKGGLGLGLTIVKRILDRHDGLITVESEPGQGTTFSISLPTATE